MVSNIRFIRPLRVLWNRVLIPYSTQSSKLVLFKSQKAAVFLKPVYRQQRRHIGESQKSMWHTRDRQVGEGQGRFEVGRSMPERQERGYGGMQVS